jgi:hypothetical protein
MAGKRKPRYSGELNRPILRGSRLLGEGQYRLYSDEINRERIFRKRFAKLYLLLAHYGIGLKEAERWLQLAFFLAVDHVPGMQVIDGPPTRKGAPRKWDLSEGRRLVELVEQINRERGRGIVDAIRVAQKRKQFKGNAAGLKTRYYEAKRLLREGEKLLHRFPRLPETP